jgi:hypothetical protein
MHFLEEDLRPIHESLQQKQPNRRFWRSRGNTSEAASSRRADDFRKGPCGAFRPRVKGRNRVRGCARCWSSVYSSWKKYSSSAVVQELRSLGDGGVGVKEDRGAAGERRERKRGKDRQMHGRGCKRKFDSRGCDTWREQLKACQHFPPCLIVSAYWQQEVAHIGGWKRWLDAYWQREMRYIRWSIAS